MQYVTIATRSWQPRLSSPCSRRLTQRVPEDSAQDSLCCGVLRSTWMRRFPGTQTACTRKRDCHWSLRVGYPDRARNTLRARGLCIKLRAFPTATTPCRHEERILDSGKVELCIAGLRGLVKCTMSGVHTAQSVMLLYCRRQM